jgi:hypothetical protein
MDPWDYRELPGLWDEQRYLAKSDIPNIERIREMLDKPPKPHIILIPPSLHKQAITDKLDRWAYLDSSDIYDYPDYLPEPSFLGLLLKGVKSDTTGHMPIYPPSGYKSPI